MKSSKKYFSRWGEKYYSGCDPNIVADTIFFSKYKDNYVAI